MKTSDKKIDSKKFYTLGEIVREELIPGVDTIPKASALVKNDAFTNKILNGTQVARGANGIQYRVMGKNIINYLVFKGI